MASSATQQLPNVVYATLAGPVDQAMVQRVFLGIATAVNAGVQEIHLLFQSNGGNVGEGVALYNYLRVLPIDLHLYNAGTVASIAVIAFLGGKNRYASAHATFMIHRTYINPAAFPPANATRLRSIADALQVDDARTRAILEANLRMTRERLDEHLTNEVPFDAPDALQCGLITAIREFAPPIGSKLFNI